MLICCISYAGSAPWTCFLTLCSKDAPWTFAFLYNGAFPTYPTAQSPPAAFATKTQWPLQPGRRVGGVWPRMMGKPVCKKASAGHWGAGRTFPCSLRSLPPTPLSLSFPFLLKKSCFEIWSSDMLLLFTSPISISSIDNLWSPFWIWVSSWPKFSL